METLLALHDHMQTEYTKTAKFFGEDPSMTSTEEFFGVFSTFLDQFEVRGIYHFSCYLYAISAFQKGR
jgi:hypothetical protein